MLSRFLTLRGPFSIGLCFALAATLFGGRWLLSDRSEASISIGWMVATGALLTTVLALWNQRLRSIEVLGKGIHLVFFGLLVSSSLLFSDHPGLDLAFVVLGFSMLWMLVSPANVLNQPMFAFGMGLILGIGGWVHPILWLLLLPLWFGMLLIGVSQPKSYLSVFFGMGLMIWMVVGLAEVSGQTWVYEPLQSALPLFRGAWPKPRLLWVLGLYLPLGGFALFEFVLVRQRASVFRRKTIGVLMGLGLMFLALGLLFRDYAQGWLLLTVFSFSALLANHFVHLRSRIWQDALFLYALLSAYMLELIR
ncbi:hypothetical protein GC167_00815 [bacterium]|nr:hypothetical protein [bacterium]